LLQKPILAIVNVEEKVQYQRAQAWQQVFFLFFFFFLFSFLRKSTVSARSGVATGLCVADVFRRQT
jgi:hypothetical protein